MSNIKNEIIEGNKLIAEFMKQWKGVDCYMYGKDYYGFENLRYHLSWDWLMPVVEKIEGDEVDLNISVVIKKNKCGIYRHKNSPYEIQLFLQESKSKIEAVWLAVVEFIKFYNQNKQL